MNYSVPNQEQQQQLLALNDYVATKLRNSIIWMIVGLLTTIGTMFLMLSSYTWMKTGLEYYRIILLLEIGVVFLFSFRQRTASITSMKIMFFVYAFLNGITLAVLSLAYQTDALIMAFFGALAFFIGFAIVGGLIKKDLSGFIPYLGGAILGMVVLSIASMFFQLGAGVNLFLGYFGVAVFAIFTAVDINRIKSNIINYAFEDESILERIEISGALSLYLDFINIFLSLLRIFGRR